MADRLKIQSNFLVIFEDGSPEIEYLRTPSANCGFSVSATNELRFTKPATSALGNNKTVFDAATIVDDRTGSAWPSVSDLKAFLSLMLSDHCGASGAITRNGFIDYNDTTGSVALSSNTWTTIPNNGLGAFTNKTYKPDNVSEFMDVTTGAIDVTQIDLGDTILIRNDYQINPNTNNALLEFRYTLGSGANAYTLEKIVGRLDSGSNQNYRFSLEPDLIYMGDTNTRNNPIFLQVKLSTNGTLTNAGSVIQLIKR